MTRYLMVIGLFALTSVALTWVRSDFLRQDKLSGISGVLVWLVYLWHGALVAYFAWRSLWPLALAQPILLLLGGTLALLGTLLFALAVRQFRSLARMSGQKEDDLITSGVYRYSRNPQNVGWFLFLVGVGPLGGSAASLMLTLVFWLVLHIYLVTTEEPHLSRVFGERYRRYLSATPRYLGFAKSSVSNSQEPGY